MTETKPRKRRQRPYPLKKPVTRLIDKNLVVVLKDAGLEVRVYGHQKSVTLTWDSIVDLAVRSARNGRLPGKLFAEPVFPEVTRITDFTMDQLSKLQPQSSEQSIF